MLKLKLPILWQLNVKNWLIWKDPDAGKDWGQEEKGVTEEEMVGWHHQLDGHEFEQAPGVDDGQGILACCSQWGHKESDMTEQLNWKIFYKHFLFLGSLRTSRYKWPVHICLLNKDCGCNEIGSQREHHAKSKSQLEEFNSEIKK